MSDCSQELTVATHCSRRVNLAVAEGHRTLAISSVKPPVTEFRVVSLDSVRVTCVRLTNRRVSEKNRALV